VIVTGGHEGGGSGVVPAEGDDAIEVVEGDAEFGFALQFHRDCFAVFFEVGSFEGDEEGVEVGFHLEFEVFRTRWRGFA
jgi:hypothetical protein